MISALDDGSEKLLLRIVGEYTARELPKANLDEAGEDWPWKEVDMPAAWKTSEGEGVKACVLDTGADLQHPDFQGAIAEARDFTGSRVGPDDIQGHGTWCASVVGGRKNGKYAVGIAPKCTLYIGKVLGDNGTGRSEWIAAGIRWAADNGCRVVSMSLGAPVESIVIRDAITYYYAKVPDGVIICAAGNDGRTTGEMGWPARDARTVPVASLNRFMRPSDFSSWGPNVAIAAPGEDVIGAAPLPLGMVAMSGTSMACPWVAGVCVLWCAKHPGKGVSAFKQALEETAQDLGEPGKDDRTGWGYIRPDLINADLRPGTPPPEGMVWVLVQGKPYQPA